MDELICTLKKRKKKNKQLCYASYLGIVKIVSLNLYLRKKNIFQYTFILLYFNLHNNNQSKLIYNHKFLSEKEKKSKKEKRKKQDRSTQKLIPFVKSFVEQPFKFTSL